MAPVVVFNFHQLALCPAMTYHVNVVCSNPGNVKVLLQFERLPRVPVIAPKPWTAEVGKTGPARGKLQETPHRLLSYGRKAAEACPAMETQRRNKEKLLQEKPWKRTRNRPQGKR